MLSRLLALVMLSAFSGSAALAADGAECAAIPDPDARLNCYDSLFKVVEPPTTVENWRSDSSMSLLDDSKIVTLFLSSDAPIRSRFGSSQPADMIVRCKENTTALYFLFADQFMSDIQGYGRVSYRIDSAKAAVWPMDVSTDNKALGLWSGSTSIPAIKQLIGGNSLFLRVTPYNESAIEMTFTIAGLEAAVKPLREACGW